MDPVTHFEIPAGDRARASEFYSKAFGWQTNQLGPEMGDYVIVTTTETDEKRMVKRPGAINGGIFQKSAPDQHPRLTIAVKDIRASMEKIKAAGGIVVGGMRNPGEPDEIPGVGLYATFMDSEGNSMSIIQPFNML